MKHIVFTASKIVTVVIVVLAFIASSVLGLANGLQQEHPVATPLAPTQSASATEAPPPAEEPIEPSVEKPTDPPVEEYHYPAEFEELIAGTNTVVIFTEPENYIKDIPLSEELQAYTYKMCAKYHISAYYNLILTVMWAESNFDPYAISDTNDYGLMQINDCNLLWLQENLGIYDMLDPYQNIEAGVYYLAKYIIKYHNMKAALMCYKYGEYGAISLWEVDVHSTDYCNKILDMLPYIENNIYYSYN